MKKSIYLILVISFFASCSNDNTKKEAAENETVESNSAVKGGGKFIAINGVNLPDKLGFGGTIRYFAGGGYREAFFVRAYTLGLYMKEKSLDPQVIIGGDSPMTVRLQMTTSMLTNTLMEKYIREGFEQSTNGNVEPFNEMIDMICGLFRFEPTIVGDVYDIHYTPNVGISCSKNGESYDYGVLGDDYDKVIVKGDKLSKVLDSIKYTSDGHQSIANLEFKQALFGIWFSDNPVDEELKMSVLGIEE